VRPPPGAQVALELGRQVDRGDRIPRADRARRGAEVVGAFDDRDARRGRHGLHEQPRARGMVHVDHGHAEAAHDGRAEGETKQDEGDHRHAEQQEARHRVAPDPAHLAPDHRGQAWGGRAHECRSDQSV
jgi:hypothetical protein